MRATTAVVSCLVVMLAAGCGKDADPGKPVATQVAAKVNSDEITVHQVNAALGRTPNVSPPLAEQAKREVLERLIDQQLAMQQAIHKKLDRTPAVQMAMEAARREILARAYMDQVFAAEPKPTAEEIKQYYAGHPALFAQRRVFMLEELAVSGGKEIAEPLRQRAAKARSLKDIADWLQARQVPFSPNRGVRAAEQIPLELLPKLQAAKDGEIVITESGDLRRVIRVVTSRAEPVDEATASPRIAQFLANRRSREVAEAELKQLKAGAEIRYTGEFAEPAAAAAKVRAEAEDKQRVAAQAKAKAQAEEEARAAEATRVRLAAEAQSRKDAEERTRASAEKPSALPQEAIKKGLGAFK